MCNLLHIFIVFETAMNYEKAAANIVKEVNPDLFLMGSLQHGDAARATDGEAAV